MAQVLLHGAQNHALVGQVHVAGRAWGCRFTSSTRPLRHCSKRRKPSALTGALTNTKARRKTAVALIALPCSHGVALQRVSVPVALARMTYNSCVIRSTANRRSPTNSETRRPQ